MVTSNGVTTCGSKFPPTVITTTINTAQYPKPYQQYETPTIPAVVIPRCCFLSPTITAFVHNHTNLSSDVSPYLPTYNNHNLTQYTVIFLQTTSKNCPNCPNANIQQYILISQCLAASW
jgi:hypothetical protein